MEHEQPAPKRVFLLFSVLALRLPFSGRGDFFLAWAAARLASIAVQQLLPQSKAYTCPVVGNSCRRCRSGEHSPGCFAAIRPLLDKPLTTRSNKHYYLALQSAHWFAKNHYQPYPEDVGEPAWFLHKACPAADTRPSFC